MQLSPCKNTHGAHGNGDEFHSITIVVGLGFMGSPQKWELKLWYYRGSGDKRL